MRTSWASPTGRRSDGIVEEFRERMRGASERSGSKVVLALDFSDPHEQRLGRAEAVLRATSDGICAVKVNHHLLLPFGLEGIGGIIKECKKAGLPLIADLKLNDIEATNLNVADSLMHYGFDAVIANPFVGREEGLGKMVEAVHSRSGGVIFLVYMSHAGAREGYALVTDGGKPLYRLFAERAREWGADGIVVSAKSADMIKEARGIVGPKTLIFSPGVGSQGGKAGSAEDAGADFVIVGRTITEASDPAKALEGIRSG